MMEESIPANKALNAYLYLSLALALLRSVSGQGRREERND
jgi:hypothetical protein